MIRVKTVHFKIFFSYTVLVVAIILIFLISFSLYMSDILRQNASDSLQQLSITIADDVDLELKNLSTIALKVISSEPIKKTFFDNTDNPNSKFANEKDLADLILSIEGPQRSFFKLTLYRNDGLGFEYGISNSFVNYNMDEIKNTYWAKETLKLEGKRLVVPTGYESGDGSNKLAISICQAFAEIYGMEPNNLIKVSQDYMAISNIVDKNATILKDNESQEKGVYIFDGKGNIIYPFSENNKDTKIADYYSSNVKGLKSNTGNLIIKNPVNGENTICAYSRSDYSGFTILVLESEKTLIQPVNVFIKNILLVGILFLIIMLIVTYFVSRSLTVPIKGIRNSIKELDLNSLTPSKKLSHFNSDIDELQELNSTFLEMKERLKESLEEAVSARSHEIQSRMLALQAQMNPHFLYNSLAYISIMCEEQGNDEVVKFCKELSNMLRYISSDSFEHVKLKQELDYTRNYLYLIERRYNGMFRFEIEIPEALLNEEVPKLIIQPLVENCIKYGMGNEAPWIVKIAGELFDDYWCITVSDNGTGFDDKKLESIKQRLLQTDSSKEMPSLKLNGMGLINIYIRLKLFYDNKMMFKIENPENGGTAVTIGGLFKTGRKDVNG